MPWTKQLAGFNVHIVGCSMASSGMLELVLAIGLKSAAPPTTVFHMQHPLVEDQLPAFHVNGCRCEPPFVGQHTVSIICDCTSPTANESIVVSAKTRLGIDKVTFNLSVAPMRIAPRMACTGRVIHGDFKRRLDLLRQAQVQWLAAGFGGSIVFARSEEECIALRRVPGLLCEHRGSIDPAAAARTAHLYEQPVLNAVCLAYARTARADFLALADTDDFAPFDLPYVLAAAAQHKRIAGVRLFFDAEQTCPANYCPANETDWRERCRAAPDAASARRKRNHWKPIVIPNRTREVAMHQFWPLGSYVRKQVWRICYSHRQPPIRAAISPLQVEGLSGLLVR